MQHPDQQVAPVADMTVKHQCSPEADEYDESRFTMEMANDESDPFNRKHADPARCIFSDPLNSDRARRPI